MPKTYPANCTQIQGEKTDAINSAGPGEARSTFKEHADACTFLTENIT